MADVGARDRDQGAQHLVVSSREPHVRSLATSTRGARKPGERFARDRRWNGVRATKLAVVDVVAGALELGDDPPAGRLDGKDAVVRPV